MFSVLMSMYNDWGLEALTISQIVALGSGDVFVR